MIADSLPHTASDAILTVDGLNVHYDTTSGPAKAVSDVSFSLRPGERLGLIGESGSGKTTMATALMRLTRGPGPDRQRQRHARRPRHPQNVDQGIAGNRLRDIALIPQGAMSSLNPVMRLEDQIIDAIAAHVPKMSREALDQRVVELLARVGLDPSVARRYPHELSGGMMQRAAMAIATSLQPKVYRRGRADQRPRRGGAAPGDADARQTAGRHRRGGGADRPRHGPHRAVRRHRRG